MPQRRYSEYGTPITALDARIVQGGLHSEGLYYGMDLKKVDEVTLGIFNGFLLLPVDDSEVIELTSDDPTQPTLELDISPTTYPHLAVAPPAGSEYWAFAVVCTHTAIEVLGGQPAIFSIVFDALNPTQPITDVAGGTIIGWIFHPGNGQALTDSMLVQAPRLQINELLALVLDSRPLNMTVHDLMQGIQNPAFGSTMAMSLPYTPGDLGVNIINPNLGPTDALDVYYQIVAHGQPFQYLNFEAIIPALSWIEVAAWDVAGAAINLDPLIINPGSVAWADYQVRTTFPYTTAYDFTKGHFWTLRMRYQENVAAAPMIRIRNLRITNWRLPFTDPY